VKGPALIISVAASPFSMVPLVTSTLAVTAVAVLATAASVSAPSRQKSGERQRQRRGCPSRKPIRRVQMGDLDEESFYKVMNRGINGTPFILEGLMPRWKAMTWTEAALRSAIGDASANSRDVTVADFFDTVGSSTPESSRYFTSASALIELAGDLEPDPFRALDWMFDWWSQHVLGYELFLGGAGARSNLHVDMYNWTGTHALISGEKVWRFLPRAQGPESLGGVVRKPFGGGAVRDYVAEVDLFANATPGACGTLPGVPPIADRGPDLRKHPAAAGLMEQVVEVVQRPGEVLVLPSGWWHQTFHTGPTIGVSGQFIATRDVPVFVKEVLDANQERGGRGRVKRCVGKLGKVKESNVGAVLERLYRCLAKHGWIDADPPPRFEHVWEKLRSGEEL